MKRIIALVLAVLTLAALFAACKKTPDPAPGETTVAAGQPTAPDGSAQPGASNPAGQTEPPEQTEAPGLKEYSSPKRIPTVEKGKDYTEGGIPDGVAEIFSMDGKLLFTFVTRWQGNEETRSTQDFYTLFEYIPASGRCRAVSPEVGYIMRIGDRFLYDKQGVDLNADNFWDVPYFTNNSGWTDEQQITGAEARALISAPKTALIKGKVQPYGLQRSGTSIALTLPASEGEVLALTLDPRGISGSKEADGLIIDIRGAANEKLWLSVGFVPEEGKFIKELYSLPIAGGAPTPVRHNGNAIWVDPFGGLEDGVIYGYSILPDKSRQLLRVDTATGNVQLLVTVKDATWHCVANDEYVLYEVPKKDGKETLECVKIGS